MRKTVLSAVAAMGFLMIGLTAFGGHALVRQADAEGSGADVPVTRHRLFAMIDTDHNARQLLVAMLAQQPNSDAAA